MSHFKFYSATVQVELFQWYSVIYLRLIYHTKILYAPYSYKHVLVDLFQNNRALRGIKDSDLLFGKLNHLPNQIQVYLNVNVSVFMKITQCIHLLN